MLETILPVGSSASWLPRNEASSGGTGALCSKEAAQLDGNRGTYLPFVPNGINSVVQQGQDVISYNFTGCLMAVFTQNGVQRVCHVSTGANQDCKAAWDAIKSSSTNVFEFRPSDFIETRGGAFTGCYGLITSDLRTFAITVVSSPSGPVVAGVKMAHLLRP